jgi:hypothetical protein
MIELNAPQQRLTLCKFLTKTAWHPVCYSNRISLMSMKKPLKKNSRNYSLGDLILAVSSYSKNNRETVAAVADLLESGQVRLTSQGRKIRARVY